MPRSVTPRYFLTIFAVAIGASFQFYNTNIVNNTQPVVQRWISETYRKRSGTAPSNFGLTVIWSILTSALHFGALLGASTMRLIAERIGRKRGLIMCGCLAVTGCAVQFSAKWLAAPELVIIGRFVVGINLGLVAGLAPMYLTEVTPVHIRGAAATSHMIAIAFGDVFALFTGLPQILGSERLWPFAYALPALPAALMILLLSCFCPESPRYLLMGLGRHEQSRQALRELVGEEKVDDGMQHLIRESVSNGASAENSGISQLFRNPHLRSPLMISIMIMVAQQFTGTVAVFTYSTDIFMQARLSAETARLSTLGIGLIYFFCVLPSAYLIERLGRRPLELCQLSGCCLALIFLSTFVAVQKWTDNGAEWTSFASIGTMGFYMAVYGFGSPVAWLLTSELFAQEHRSAAVSVSIMTSMGLAIIVTLGYLPFQRIVGAQFSFLPFICVLIGSIIFMSFLLPETKNRSIEDIVSDFRRRRDTLSRSIDSERNSETAALLKAENQELANAYGSTNGKE